MKINQQECEVSITRRIGSVIEELLGCIPELGQISGNIVELMMWESKYGIQDKDSNRMMVTREYNIPSFTQVRPQ